MEPRPEPKSMVWSFAFPEQDWEQTPPAVQASVHTLHDEMGPRRHEMHHLQKRGESLAAQLSQHSATSSRPPSSDSPSTTPRRRTGLKGSRTGGGKPGHQGHRQELVAPTTVEELMPESCACGSGAFGRVRPSSTPR